MNSVFESAINVTNSGNIGTPKMIRIDQTCFSNSMPHKEALQCCLYENIKLSTDQLGDVEEIFAKSRGYANTIVSLRHKNRCMSHFSINFTKAECPPLLHIEISADSGLLKFDSSKGSPITLSTGNYSYWSADLPQMAASDSSQYVKDITADVFSSIEQNSIIRR